MWAHVGRKSRKVLTSKRGKAKGLDPNLNGYPSKKMENYRKRRLYRIEQRITQKLGLKISQKILLGKMSLHLVSVIIKTSLMYCLSQRRAYLPSLLPSSPTRFTSKPKGDPNEGHQPSSLQQAGQASQAGVELGSSGVLSPRQSRGSQRVPHEAFIKRGEGTHCKPVPSLGEIRPTYDVFQLSIPPIPCIASARRRPPFPPP